jgi:hypothetical protein
MRRQPSSCERLECREVFSVDPVVGSLALTSALPANSAWAEISPTTQELEVQPSRAIELNTAGDARQLLHNMGHESPMRLSGVLQVDARSDASGFGIGRPDETRQQIIAILIGLAYPPPGTTPAAGESLVGTIDEATFDEIATESRSVATENRIDVRTAIPTDVTSALRPR